jgi:hypothetical protein
MVELITNIGGYNMGGRLSYKIMVEAIDGSFTYED